VALSLAHAYPEKVGRLVLVGAWVYYDQLPSFILWSRVPVLGEALFTLFFAEQPEMRYKQVYFAADEHVKEEEIEVMERGLEWPGVKRAALQAARDQRLEELEPFYPEVTHETLLVWGEEDRVSFPFYARRLASDLPHARLVFVPHCGHVPFVESPSLFADLVLEFLGQEVAR
jgi:pimeloyl-ACP methyl ester carboxylesterase